MRNPALPFQVPGATPSDHLSIEDDDRPDRLFTRLPGKFGFFERFPHEGFVVKKLKLKDFSILSTGIFPASRFPTILAGMIIPFYFTTWLHPNG